MGAFLVLRFAGGDGSEFERVQDAADKDDGIRWRGKKKDIC